MLYQLSYSRFLFSHPTCRQAGYIFYFPVLPWKQVQRERYSAVFIAVEVFAPMEVGTEEAIQPGVTSPDAQRARQKDVGREGFEPSKT